MSKHIPQVPGQFTEGDDGLPEFWQKEFATSKEVAAAMKLLDITSIQTCPKCRQMWVNLNEEKCRKCGASMVHVVETKPAATVHGTGSGNAHVPTHYCIKCGAEMVGKRNVCLNCDDDMPTRFTPSGVPTPPASPTVTADYEYPPDVKNIFDRCEANVVNFSNDDVSTLLVEIDRLAALLRAAEQK